jgi:hypothetical protein
MTEKAKKAIGTPKANSKAKSPAKPRKKAAATNGAHANVREIRISHEQVAQLAHQYWTERGHQHGQHEDDWYRAEQELRAKAS